MATNLFLVDSWSEQAEGNSGTTAYVFTINRTGTISGTSSVQWGLSTQGWGNRATTDDFTGATSGTVNFAVNQTTATFTVYVNGDTTVENFEEDFTVFITSPSAGTTIIDEGGNPTDYGYAGAEIINDDDGIGATTGTAQALSVNGAWEENIHVVGDQDWYSLSLVAGTTYVFGMLPDFDETPTLDAYLRLLASDGTTQLAFNDNMAGALGTTYGFSQLTYTAATTGTYYLSAQGTSRAGWTGTGGYAITANVAGQDDNTATSVATTTASLSLNDSLDIFGTVHTAGDEDWFRVYLEAGEDYWLAVSTDGVLGASLTLFNSSGTQVGVGALDPEGTSEWYIDTTGQGLAAGDYYLRVQGTSGTGFYGIWAERTSIDYMSPDKHFAITSLVAQVQEADSGVTPYVFMIERDGMSDQTASVDWSVAGSGANAANAADFAGGVLPSGTVNFAAGEAVKYITVNIVGDNATEPHETFTVTLSNPSGGTLADGYTSAIGTINDDDLQINGTDSANTLNGTAGNDYINGLGGNDSISGLAGNDSLYGGDGLDTLVGGDGNDNLYGGAGNDTLLGGTGNDYLDGGAGNDSIDGGVINDRINYTDSNTVSYFNSTAAVNINLNGISGTGTSGTGTVTGDASVGTDTLQNIFYVRGSTYGDSILGSEATTLEVFEGGLGDDTIDGGTITDTLNSTNSNRVSYQNAGGAVQVTLAAGSAAGSATGADGTDTLYNINQVRGSIYGDSLTGSDRFDITEHFDGRAGNDTIDGAGGDDLVRYDAASGAVTVNLAWDAMGTGQTGTATGADGNDTLYNIEGVRGSNYADSIVGAADNYWDEFFQGMGGNDTIDGGVGKNDRVDYNLATAGVNVNLTTGIATAATTVEAGIGTDTLIEIEKVRGSSFADRLTGSDRADSAEFDEWFEGREGNDTIDGKGGNDLADYYHSTAGVTVNLNLATGIATGNASVGTDTLYNIEDVYGSRDFADSITGSAAANWLVGSGGNDTLRGMGGDDILDGDDGNDSLDAGAGSDEIWAGTGADIVDGGTESDTLYVLGNFADYTRTRPDATNTRLVNTITGEDITFRNVESVTFLDGNKTLAEVQADLSTTFNDAITGTAGDDTVDGLAGNDTLSGLAGNDTLIGGTGIDSLIGGAGDDVYGVDVAGDIINETVAGSDGTDQVNVAFVALGTYTLSANVENATITNATAGVNLTGNDLDNVLTGNAAANTLTGGLGNDTLIGGAGIDNLIGGAGDDLYRVDVSGDVINETVAGSSGTDTVEIGFTSTGSYGLTAGVDHAIVTSAANIAVSVTGNDLANSITGHAGINTLLGGLGNDTLAGMGGTDTLDGGTGSADEANVLGNFADYVVTRLSETDTRLVNGATETIILKGIESVNFLDGAKTMSEIWNNTVGAMSDSWTGTAGDDTVDGQAGNDTLTGLAGNDTLIGGTGIDSLIGGAGDDVYVVDVAGDIINETVAGSDGTDQVNVAFVAAGTYVLSENVENATVTNATAGVNLTGNASDNVLTGNAAANILTGGIGNDTLIGGAGIDNLIGGAGDDLYRIDVSGDVINETVAGSGGTDTVEIGFTSTGSYLLSTNLENAIVTSAGNSFAVNVTGNTSANHITGHAGSNVLTGGDGNDTLVSGGGNDTIEGGNGTGDTAELIGVLEDYAITRPTAVQTVFTHLATNTRVTLTNVENIVFAGGGGDSLANLIGQIGSIGNDNLAGTTSDDTLAGGAGFDSLTGADGNDDLQGGDGNDTLDGGLGNDILDGGAGSDTYKLAIGGGDDIIEQNDTVAGSIDTIVLDALIGDVASDETVLSRGWHSYDDLVITVNSGSAGAEGVDHIVVHDFITNDLINTGTIDQIRFASNSTTLTQTQILSELLKGTIGDDWLRGYANTADSISGGNGNDTIGGAAGNDTLIGGLSNDILYGDAGNDSLDGGAGNDEVYGGEGNDTLSGVAGDDTLSGGAGSDTYLFGSGYGQDVIADLGLSSDVDTLRFNVGIRATDVTVARTGNDLKVSLSGGEQLLVDDYFSVSGLGSGHLDQFVFADGSKWTTTPVMAKVLVATAGNDEITGYLNNESLQGLVGNDTINGGAGNDTLNGGVGNDLLTGGIGTDRFVFNTALDEATNIDTITDFVSGTDKIGLSSSVFTGLGTVGTLAGLSSYLLYDDVTGALSYDADGAGGADAVQFAILGTGTHPATLGQDFMIVT